MSGKKLSILAICAVILAGWAILQTRLLRPRETTNMVNMPLITGLDIDAVQGIEVAGRNGAEKVRLARKDSGFVVIDKDSYPAKTASINELITGCLDIRTAELCSTDPAFEADLGVTEQTARCVVSFLDKDNKSFLTLFISDVRPNEQGCYVRLGSSDKTYLTLNGPWLSAGPMNYIDSELINLPADKITGVTVSLPGGSYTLKKSAEKDGIEMEDMPIDKYFKDTACKRVFNALSGLKFEDVAVQNDQTAGLKFDNQYICRTADSTVYTLNLAGKDGKTYLTVAAEFMDKTEVLKDNAVESQEQLREKEARLLARDKAAEFTAKTAGWVYTLPKHKADDLTMSLSDLLENIPAETKSL